MEREEVLGSQRIYSGKVVSLRVDTVRLKKGAKAVETKREIVEHSPAVVIVPVDNKGNVILVRQYRHATGQELLEAPAGGIEKGEDPRDAVLRELQEETGFTGDEVIPMRSFWMSPGFCTEEMHAFIVKKLRPSALDADEDENIQNVPTPIKDIPALIRSGAIRDSKSIAALLMALDLFDLAKPAN
ncbi:MAG: NUDIX hydrolase [Dehalococcoidia bacterium]|nr:NUDIX hydrolase [Dehalococcoidia bacterium]